MTGVLKAKVDGVWVEVVGASGSPGGGGSEVEIATSAPARVGGLPDLWVDPSDSISGIDPRLGVRVAWENDSLGMPNNASENTLASYTIPANSVQPLGGPGGMKWIFGLHALLQNTGAGAANATLRCKVNGTSAISSSAISIPNGTGERLAEIEWTLLGDNDYNLNQKARFAVSGLMAPPTTTDDLPTRRGYTRGNSIVAASWASNIVLSMTVQWSTATGTVCDMHGYDIIRYSTTPG